MSDVYENLKSRLIAHQNHRKDYLTLKSQKLKLMGLSSAPSNSINTKNETNLKNLLNEELSEIDLQIESLTSIIDTSKNIGNLIINSVNEKELILNNINDTITILETEKKIQNIIKDLENEINTEKKIEIILKGKELINVNENIFKEYNEEFLKKSLDVLSYLQTNYNSFKEKIMNNLENKNKNKEDIKEYIQEMEKNANLIYNLSNKKEYLLNFFHFLGDYIQQSLCNINFIEYIENQIQKFKKNINNENEVNIKEEIINLFIIIKTQLQKIFLKISHFMQERQKRYINLDQDQYKNEVDNNNNKNNIEIFPLLYQLLNILINSLEPYLIKLIKYLIIIIELMEKNNSAFSHDLICVESSFVISICEKFKFYITILSSKLDKYYNIRNNNNSQISLFLNNFNSILYDIGEKYCSNELLFMKNNIIKLFEDESINYKDTLISLLESTFDELSGNILNCIEDIFYILKTSGERAISTLNLQIALGIINHIKVILNEDLYYLLDFKISTNLVEQEDNNINLEELKSMTKNIKYYCNDLPSLNEKNIYGNLFLISCLDSFEQTKENIPLLLEKLKSNIYQSIINSKIFDSSLIKLVNEENEIVIKYFKNNELEMINFAFNDINGITNRYNEFIKHKLRVIFNHLYYYMNSIIDVLNNTNYVIPQSNISAIEMSETFSNKFMSETKKYLNQWKFQLHENVYSIFVEYYTEYATGYIEKILSRKNFNNYGVILLQKDINKICNFLQSDSLINIRDKFNRLFSFIKVLNFESIKELEEHMQKYNDIMLNQKEIESIFSLKV